MASIWPARWPLRLRVALAFLVTTAVALVGLGFFVQVRVADTLDERLRDSLDAQMVRLVATPAEQRGSEVEALVGDTYAQVLTVEGAVLASSGLVAGSLLDPVTAAGEGERFLEADVTVYDDDAVAAGDAGGETETEAALLLVRRSDGQLIVVGTSRQDTAEAVAEVRSQLLVGGPIALAVAGLLGYVVAGTGLRPIERLRARAATISDRSAGERLPLPAAEDELRRLAVTLNAMLDRLDEGLQRQRRFVAEASHELRTPLALMLTEVELALSRPRSPEELVGALRSTEEETRRLIALAEDLLLLAAADAGRLPIDPHPVDLTTLARGVVDRFAPTAEAESRALTLTGTDRVDVVGDANRLDQVLSNLVDNALRHGAGDVEVSVSADGGAVRLAVSDHGQGFREQRPFDRFAGTGGSSGLGLAIVQEIARAHGGSVDVAHQNGRTTVQVELPA